MKLNLKSTIAAPAGQKALNGIIGNTRRGIVVDKTLDPDSNNPVANKPVSTALVALAGKIDAALQRPTGLTKTKLVGVGTNGQENIEIGDNLTLANGKLSATGGGNSINILIGSSPKQSEDGYEGTYSGSIDDSKINILHIPDFGDFTITFVQDTNGIGSMSMDETTNVIIIASEGQYMMQFVSVGGGGGGGNQINIISPGDEDNTFNGTLVSPGLTLFSYKVPDQNFYVTMPIHSTGLWGTSLDVDDETGEMTVYSFYQFNKRYGTTKYHLKYYSHFITVTDSSSNIALYLTIQNNSVNEFNWVSLGEYLAGKKVLVNGNLHGTVPTYIAGEGGKIKIYYRTPGDNNINPTPDEFADLSSFEISDTCKPVE